MNKLPQTPIGLALVLIASIVLLSVAYNFYKGGFCKDSGPVVVTQPVPTISATPSATLEPTKTATPTVTFRRVLPTAVPSVTTTP